MLLVFRPKRRRLPAGLAVAHVVGLLVRADLRRGSATALQVIAPPWSISEGDLHGSVFVFSALGALRWLGNITATVDYLALVHAKEEPGDLGLWLFRFLKGMISDPVDMVHLAENFRATRFIDYWVLKLMIAFEFCLESHTWVAQLFELIFAEAVEQDIGQEVDVRESGIGEEPRCTGIAALLRPCFAWSTLREQLWFSNIAL